MNANNEPVQSKTMDEVCRLLVQKREELNLSQTQIAKLVGIKMNSSISRIENGHQKIPRRRITKFAKAYQLSEETLAPLLINKKGQPIGGYQQKNEILNVDILPLIKKIAAGKREKLTVAELNVLIKDYAWLQKSVESLAPEVRDLLLSVLDTPKTSQ